MLWQIDDSTGEYLDPVDLGTLSPGVNSYPVAVNDCGQVAGYSNAGGGAFQAWLVDPRDIDGDGTPEWFWDADDDGINDLMIALGPSGAATQAKDVNDAGQAVGTYSKGKQSQRSPDDGFIWQNGVMTLLHDLVPPEYSDWCLPASCINEAGQIAGKGPRLFLLTPKTAASRAAGLGEGSALCPSDEDPDTDY